MPFLILWFLVSTSSHPESTTGEKASSPVSNDTADALGADLEPLVRELRSRHGLRDGDRFILVDVTRQRLYLLGEEPQSLASYPVSTSKYGVGSRGGSNKTPLGTHRIRHKYGDGARLGTVFVARQSTGRIAKIYEDRTDVIEDLITTRILWLEGLEPGRNRGRNVDSFRRYIYIHGTPEEGLVGTPASQGCIRMRNKDVIDLFEKVDEGTLVEIRE